MTNIIDINQHLNGPDLDCIYIDEKGVKWFKYSAIYIFKAKEFAITFWAISDEEAHERIATIKDSLSFEGQILAVRPS